MAQTCPRCGAEHGDEARFCASCGAALELPSGAERKIATMVFADVVGSTALASGTDPEELRARLAPFFQLASETLIEHGGTVEKYIGDAVMAVFGVPVAHSDDPERAVAAALALVERIGAAGDGLGVRIGIETGEVLVVEPGADLAVTGEAVNAAARLQEAAQESEVLVGDRAARSCRGFRLEPAGAIDAKGFPEPLRAWRAVEAAPGGARAATPFVGREDDLALLRLVYRRAAGEGVPELVVISGEAGIGKTRLTTELLASLAEGDPEPEALVGRNPPYGRGIAFWALGEILRAAAGAGPDDSVGAVREALTARIAALGADDPEAIAGSLAAALGGSEEDGDVEDELRRGWRRLVALLAAERPLVIVLDDAHWADDGLLDLLEEAAFKLDAAPVLILCTARPELLERRPNFGRAARNVTQIELRPLRPEATCELATTLMPEATAELAQRVAQASGGNPFFTEEVARSIGSADGVNGAHLPDTVQAAISARLDLLSGEEKRVVQHAAVLGHSFDAGLLSELLGSPVEGALDGLAQKALVQERLATDPGNWSFHHQLIRDVAYATIPRADRARLHERVGERIAAAASERHAELAELIAFHRVEAAELDPSDERSRVALESTLDAAETVFRRGASVRAQELYEHAAGDLARTPAERIDALDKAAGVATRRFRGDEAVRLLREKAAVGEQSGDLSAAADAWARAVEIASRMAGITGINDESEIRSMLERGRALRDHADPATRVRLVLDEAWVAWYTSCMSDMDAPSREALEMARGLDDPILLSSTLDAASANSWNVGNYRDAVGHNKERLEILSRAPEGDPLTEVERSDALHMIVESLVQFGDFGEAKEYAGRARDADLDRGIVYSGWSRAILPSFFLGEWDEVMTMGRRCREAWNAMDQPPSAFMAASVAMAGAVCGYRADEEAFEDWMAFAEVIAWKGGQALGIKTARGDVALHRGDFEAALEHLRDDTDSPRFWWQPLYEATNAEATVMARREDASAALERAEAVAGDNQLACATLLRAQGFHEGDEEKLRRSVEVLDRIGCVYQAARTRWLIGGAEREAAASAFEALGTRLPGI